MLYIHGDPSSRGLHARVWAVPAGPIRPHKTEAMLGELYDPDAIIPYMDQSARLDPGTLGKLICHDAPPGTALWRVTIPPPHFTELANRLGTTHKPSDDDKAAISAEIFDAYQLRYVGRRLSGPNLLTTTIAAKRYPGLHLDQPHPTNHLHHGAQPIRWGYNAGPGARDSLAMVEHSIAELHTLSGDSDTEPPTTATLRRYCARHAGELLCVGLRVRPGEAYSIPAQVPSGFGHDGSTYLVSDTTMGVFFDYYGDPAAPPSGFTSAI